MVFRGEAEARALEAGLKRSMAHLSRNLRLVSLVMREDEPSQLYTGLKAEAAARVGIGFERLDRSMTEPVESLAAAAAQASARSEVTGVMIQKPARSVYEKLTNRPFGLWWETMTAAIEPKKDVDCLTRVNLDKVYLGQGRILPATVVGILKILADAQEQGVLDLDEKPKSVVVGRSELVGKPLAAILRQRGWPVSVLGSKDGSRLPEEVAKAKVVVSATGVPRLIKGEWITPGAVVIDAGSPEAEVEWETAVERAGLITPVPNGVGPMTVVSLLENLVQCAG